MNHHRQPQRQARGRMQFAIVLILVLLTGVAFFAWFRPKFFSFHANASSIGGIVSGEVFKSSDGVFLVLLNSGSQMAIRANPAGVFFSPVSSRKPPGVRIGNYLLVSAASISGLDLSKSESFDRQFPVIGEGKITLKDPMQQNGEFSFPTGG